MPTNIIHTDTSQVFARTGGDFLDALPDQDLTRPIPRPSVLDPRHPLNVRERGNGRRSSYTYLPPLPRATFSLGWELEANYGARRVPGGVNTTSDGSVNGEGREYVCLPSVTRSPQYSLGILKDLVHSPGLNTDASCGFHVHVGMIDATLSRLRTWAVATESLAKEIEDKAFKAVPSARQDNSYCQRIKPTRSGQRFNCNKYDNQARYNWLNTVEMFRPGGIRTIEVRLLGNTHRWKYLLSWSLFSLALAREGWKVANRPFEDRSDSVRVLSEMLDAIATEIRPLEKRKEPVPVWVRSWAGELGLDYGAWDRPLLKVSNDELALGGQRGRFYSDCQETVPNDDDEDGDSCACGCGTDGRCDDQVHNDGDCDSNYCYSCCDNGDCSGSPLCERCQDTRHDDEEYCGGRECRHCRNEHRGPWADTTLEPPTATTVQREIENCLIDDREHSCTGIRPSTMDAVIGGGVLTTESIQRAVNTLMDQRIDNASLTATNAMLTGYRMGRVTYDDVMTSAGWTEINGRLWATSTVLPTLPEELALPMTDNERLASDARERAYAPSQGRAFTMREIENREYDALRRMTNVECLQSMDRDRVYLRGAV